MLCCVTLHVVSHILRTHARWSLYQVLFLQRLTKCDFHCGCALLTIENRAKKVKKSKKERVTNKVASDFINVYNTYFGNFSVLF